MPEEKPTDDDAFMNERQRDYFRQKLLAWKDDILKEAKETLQLLQDGQNHPDFTDRASSETDRAMELRARDRQRKLIPKIDVALRRIEDGTYGYCEDTGEPIAIKRLEARPIATLSIEAVRGSGVKFPEPTRQLRRINNAGGVSAGPQTAVTSLNRGRTPPPRVPRAPARSRRRAPRPRSPLRRAAALTASV